MSGTYTYADLQSAIAAAANTSPFSISGAALQSAQITTLFQAWFAADQLSINLGGNKPVDNGSQLTVTGTLSKAFQGNTSPAVQAVFSVVNGVAQVTVTISAASGWAPSMIFPSLQKSAFDDLVWNNLTISLASSGTTALPANFPADFGGAAYSPAPSLAPAQSLSATVCLASGQTLGQGLASLSWALVEGTSVPISGTFALPSQSPTSPPCMELTANLGTVTLGAFSGKFTLLLGRSRSTSPSPTLRPPRRRSPSMLPSLAPRRALPWYRSTLSAG